MSFIDRILNPLGYVRATKSVPTPTVRSGSPLPAGFQKDAGEREAFALNPMAAAYNTMSSAYGLRRASGITFQTLRRMSRFNWVDRTCINTLRDEITAIDWDIVPVDEKEDYNEDLQDYLIKLLKKPSSHNSTFRTLIDKVVEDILVCDAGVIEKVRDQKGRIAELYHVDGATVKPMYDRHGMVGDPAYIQVVPGMGSTKPVAEWKDDELIYMMWNPQGAIDNFGYGMSPVESGLAVGTAFLYAEAYNLGFFQSNTIPATIINMGKDVPPGEIDKFRSFLAAEMQGQNGWWQPIIASFGDGFNVQQLLKSPADMALKDYVLWQMRWKVALYRMSPQDIGFTLDQYKVEGQVQQQLSKNKAIKSLAGILTEYINNEIIDDKGFGDGHNNLEFTWIDPQIIDPKAQAEIDKIYLEKGVYSINDIRKRNGEDPIAGGIKPTITVGPSLVPVSPNVINQDEYQQQIEADTADKSLSKSYKADTIGKANPMTDQNGAICWMDDRGVTQPLFITDTAKTYGLCIKPIHLDERKDQEPPEEGVAKLLQLIKVNTPEVKLCTYDEMLKLLPENVYGDVVKYINLTPPYDSQQWRQRWGDSRMADKFIITGFVDGQDLGNENLQKEMAMYPERYTNVMRDFARIWVSEKIFKLGDRKRGHYLVSKGGYGFGVDYTFWNDEKSWAKTHNELPDVLKEINPKLLDVFNYYVGSEEKTFAFLEKAAKKKFTGIKRNEISPISAPEEAEKKIARAWQKRLLQWYRKAVKVNRRNIAPVRKADEFDPAIPYITNGQWVWQGSVKYPSSVLDDADLPSQIDLSADPTEYKSAWNWATDYATMKMKLITTQDIAAATFALQRFQDRTDWLVSSIDDTLRSRVERLVSDGLDAGETYAEIGDDIANSVDINVDDPEDIGYYAERIGRTEGQWAVNQGVLDQEEAMGVTQWDLLIAPDACDECVDVQAGGPYSRSECDAMSDGDDADLHPNCRCTWQGDMTPMMEDQSDMIEMSKRFNSRQAKEIGTKLAIDWKKVKLSEFVMGMNEELEHTDITGGDPLQTAKIVMAHLNEDPNYYTKLSSAIKKAMPNVINTVTDPNFTDEAQMKHPEVGKCVYMTYGELIAGEDKELVKFLFEGLAKLAVVGKEFNGSHVSMLAQTDDLKFAVSDVNAKQRDNPKNAYAVIIKPVEFNRIVYLMYQYVL